MVFWNQLIVAGAGAGAGAGTGDGVLLGEENECGNRARGDCRRRKNRWGKKAGTKMAKKRSVDRTDDGYPTTVEGMR